MGRPPPSATQLRILIAGLVGCSMTACSSTEISGLPPIAVSGSVANVTQTREFEDEPREYSNSVTSTLRARSYIWQPWFMTTDGGGSLTHRLVEGGINNNNALVASGDITLGILPVSEYPSTISYSHTDSRTEGTLGFDYVRDRISVTNRASIASDLKTSTRFTYQTVDQEEVGTQEDISAGLTVNKNFIDNALTMNLQYSDSAFQASQEDDEDEDQLTALATLSHSYTPDSTFNLQNRFTAIRDENDEGDRTRDRLSLQAVSQGFWRPTEAPYTVTSALRALREEVSTGGTGTSDDSDQILISGAVGLNYPITARLTTNLGVNALYEDSLLSEDAEDDGAGLSGRRLEVGVSANAAYISLDFDLAGFDWRWNASTNAQGNYRSQQVSDDGGPNGAGSASLGHSVTRRVDVPFVGATRFSASQSGGVRVTSDDSEGDFLVPNVSHDVSFTLNDNSDGVSTYARLSASDRREFLAEDAVEFQLLQLQFNRQVLIDLDDNWVAALSLQGSRRKQRGDSADISVAANGRVAYFSKRVFGVDDLDFSSELELNAIGLEDTLRLDEDEDRDLLDDIRADWTNKLSYRIGRITASLEGGLFMVGDAMGNSVLLRLRRDFDGVF